MHVQIDYIMLQKKQETPKKPPSKKVILFNFPSGWLNNEKHLGEITRRSFDGWNISWKQREKQNKIEHFMMVVIINPKKNHINHKFSFHVVCVTPPSHSNNTSHQDLSAIA